MRDMPKGEYLIIAPDKPTPEEYARGARLIPSMLDEGVKVWRVPALKEPLGNPASIYNEAFGE